MRWMGFAGLGAGAIALSPILANALAPGTLLQAAASSSISYCGSAMPTGLAAGISTIIGQVPVVGTALAAGGIATIGTAAGLAIGGMLLGNYLDKHHKPGSLPWGRIVRWSCLVTSALIAAPMVISGLAMGLSFIGQYLLFNGVDAGGSLIGFAQSTLGTLGTSGAFSGTAMAQGSAALMGVHAITCALPLGLSGFLLGKKPGNDQPQKLPSLQLPPLRQHDGRVTQPQLQVVAG